MDPKVDHRGRRAFILIVTECLSFKMLRDAEWQLIIRIIIIIIIILFSTRIL